MSVRIVEGEADLADETRGAVEATGTHWDSFAAHEAPTAVEEVPLEVVTLKTGSQVATHAPGKKS